MPDTMIFNLKRENMNRSRSIVIKSLLLTVLTLSLFKSPIDAANTTIDVTQKPANILEKDWNIDGTIGFVKYNGRYSNTSEYNFSANAQYFLANRFSLGLLMGYEKESSLSPIASAGPVASYYFWQDGKVATFVRGFYRAGLTSSTVNSIIGVVLGANYFIVPSVSFGPSIFYNFYESDYSNYSRIGISFGFGLYF